jgi:hypothetical protein
VKVIPLAKVVAEFLKNANVAFSGFELNKVGPIFAHEGNRGLNAAQPDVVENDVTADGAERRVKIKVSITSSKRWLPSIKIRSKMEWDRARSVAARSERSSIRRKAESRSVVRSRAWARPMPYQTEC